MSFRLEELPLKEQEEITKELQEVLAKHDCEMQVTSRIEILKRVEDKDILSPIQNIHGEPGETAKS